MIQKFLNNSFIQISEDDNLGKLRKACDEVAKKIIKDKSKIITYTLTALDPDVSAENVTIKEVQEIIIKHWNTFIANAKDSQITVIRAVMLEALEAVSKETNHACLIWLTGRNIIKYYKLGREENLLADFLLALGNRIEEEATEKWSLPSEIKIEKLSLDLKELTGVSIDKAEIELHLRAASIHPSWGNEGENPHTTNQGNVNWALFFSQRSAQGLTDTINKALKKQAKDLSANQTLIQEAVNKLLVQTQSEILQKNGLLQMRTNLLWWKEACYSPLLKGSYRNIDNGLLQLILAADYSSFVPSLYPVSTDYFLKEVHNYIVPSENQNLQLSELIKLIIANTEKLKTIFVEVNIDGSRISLMQFIKGLVWGKCTPSDVSNLLGISDITEINKADFTLWMFHDLQSSKITLTK